MNKCFEYEITFFVHHDTIARVVLKMLMVIHVLNQCVPGVTHCLKQCYITCDKNTETHGI